jgi:hypothetical protein
MTLVKRLLLAATFIIWAIDQLIDSGKLATLIGDVVVAAYVLDLYWLIQEQISAVNSPSDCRPFELKSCLVESQATVNSDHH